MYLDGGDAGELLGEDEGLEGVDEELPVLEGGEVFDEFGVDGLEEVFLAVELEEILDCVLV